MANRDEVLQAGQRAPASPPLSAESLSWAAWLIWALSAALALSALLLLARNTEGGPADLSNALLGQPVGPLLFPLVGGLIVLRQPSNPVGWLLSGLGLVGAVSDFAREYARYALITQVAAGAPAGQAMAWLFRWVWFLAQGPMITFLVLLFPNGHLLSPRWKPVGWMCVIGTAMAITSAAFWPMPVAGLPNVENPLGNVLPSQALATLGQLGQVLMGTALLGAFASVIARLRSSHGREHRQLVWFASAVALAALSLVVELLFPYQPLSRLLGLVASVWLGLAAGISIVRHQLYGINLIINRTLVYVPLTGILGGLYTASVGFFQRLFLALTGNTSDAAIVITTLMVAGTFTPVKNALQSVVDRYFKEVPSDPRSLSSYAKELNRQADLVDPHQVAAGLLQKSVASLSAKGGAVYIVHHGSERLAHSVGQWQTEEALSVPLTGRYGQVGKLLLAAREDGLEYSESELETLRRAAVSAGRLIDLLGPLDSYQESESESSPLEVGRPS